MIEDGRNIASTTNINDEHYAPASINNINEATLSAGAANLINNDGRATLPAILVVRQRS